MPDHNTKTMTPIQAFASDEYDEPRRNGVVPTVERPVALVVEASFDSDTFTIDTTTIDGQRVVVMYMRDGVRYLTPAETLALSRALLSRLAYVGFPEEAVIA